MAVTRRGFLARVAAGGGYAAAFTALQALGMLPSRAEASTLPALPPGYGVGRKVVILGAGIAGLVSAYELRKAGFDCTILEARDRPGGRNWSVRNGSKVEFVDGTVQDCTWEDGHYLNAGPARIPSIHTNLLQYCEDLGVPLEVEINTSRSALVQHPGLNGGKPVQQRQVMHDTRGYLAELLAKASQQHKLDDLLTGQDTEQLMAFLRSYGDLDDAYAYRGTPRGGWASSPGAAEAAGVPRAPLSRQELLVRDLSRGSLYEEQINWQATMMQPVGGMDRIPYAFAKALGDIIQYGAPIQEIRKTPKGVKVVYAKAGRSAAIEADYCICTLPLPILQKLKTDFSPAHRTAFSGMDMTTSYKVAWESPRFWEKNDHIYGGISFPESTVDLIWYPSDRLFSKTGVLVGGFGQEIGRDGKITAFGALPDIPAKLAASRAAVETLHPGHGKDLTKPIYVSWVQIPYSLGCAAANELPAAKPAYDQLSKPDGRLILAGDYLSHQVAWQEGAILSAHRAIAGMVGHMRQAA
jgi:monoamine oxidase